MNLLLAHVSLESQRSNFKMDENVYLLECSILHSIEYKYIHVLE